MPLPQLLLECGFGDILKLEFSLQANQSFPIHDINHNICNVEEKYHRQEKNARVGLMPEKSKQEGCRKAGSPQACRRTVEALI